jgi:hypothetical protein
MYRSEILRIDEFLIHTSDVEHAPQICASPKNFDRRIFTVQTRYRGCNVLPYLMKYCAAQPTLS